NNAWGDNGLDVALARSPTAPGEDNCLLDQGLTTDPADRTCGPGPRPYAQPVAPLGVSFSPAPLPPDRPALEDGHETPPALPEPIERPDPASFDIPDADLLEASS